MIKGLIFDYGGTLDSRGVHWSEVIWNAYRDEQVPIDKDTFRDAYVYAERELARIRHIHPEDDFYTLLLKKMTLELQWLEEHGHDLRQQPLLLAKLLATRCDRAARQCLEEARPVLNTLAQRFPMMLVSNFYGNIDTVLRAYNVRHYFKGIIESAMVGVRKPNPTLFRLGVDALELRPDEVLVVGDSLKKDILPAIELGCQAVWLKGKGWTPDEDAQLHPQGDRFTITRLTELLDII